MLHQGAGDPTVSTHFDPVEQLHNVYSVSKSKHGVNTKSFRSAPLKDLAHTTTCTLNTADVFEIALSMITSTSG